MGATLIPNQTVTLIENDETLNQRNSRLFWDRREFCQLIKNNQVTQFQMKVTPVSGNNLIANGDFNGNLNSWTRNPIYLFIYLNGKANSVSSTTQLAQLYQPTPILANKTYRVDFDVAFFGDGQTFLSVNLDSSTPIGGSLILDSVNFVDGTYSTYWRTGTVSTTNITFGVNTSDLSSYVTIDNVTLYELTEPIVTLEDCNGNYIKDINTVARYKDYITYTHPWTQADGCYRLCFYNTNDDSSFNLLGEGLCIVDERNAAFFDEKSECIKYL